MVKIKGKITKVGNSYGVLVKKALVDAEVLQEGQEVELEMITKREENSGLMTRTYDAHTTTIPIIAED